MEPTHLHHIHLLQTGLCYHPVFLQFHIVFPAELAANCANNECMSKLYEISHKSHRAYMDQNYKDFLEDDLEFHLCIAECSGNQVIYSLMQTINNLMKRVSRTGMVNEEQLRHVYEEHQKIYGFILTHDAKGARDAMEEHPLVGFFKLSFYFFLKS